MKLGIPTLCRYDLLEKLVRSVERGTRYPTGYIIVDNGGGLDRDTIRSWLSGVRSGKANEGLVDLITPGRNLGVAASWNLIIDRAAPEPVVISNDDMELGGEAFDTMASELLCYEFVEGDGWALFGQRAELIQKVGYYDENFWPAYYEDVDYDERLSRAGIVMGHPSITADHHGWATTRALSDAAWLKEGRERNHAYFLAKWGGESRNPRWNGNADIFQYDKPFDGKPPPGWNERKRMSESVIAMRWDVLNYIAKTIDAKRYLEIGVNDGDCIKRINVESKWGVDPNPSDHAIHCEVLIPRTSEYFFNNVAPLVQKKFDLIFIDGDHRAELVYNEIRGALRVLDPGGVICLHDCNPHTDEMQQVPMRAGGAWTGDVWKTVARLRAEGELHVRTVPSDYGTAILFRGSPEFPAPVNALPCDWERLMWKDLLTDRESLLGLLDPTHWQDWVDRIPSMQPPR